MRRPLLAVVWHKDCQARPHPHFLRLEARRLPETTWYHDGTPLWSFANGIPGLLHDELQPQQD